MKTTFFAFVALLCGPVLSHAQLSADGATASFKGSLPPKPSADISPEQQAAIEKRLAEVTAKFQTVKKHKFAADADIFLKAVRYALEFHEWYDKKPEDGEKKANALLDEAAKRIESLKVNKTPWMEGSGVKVLGFYSNIDDSPQPYGVEVPEGLEWGAGKKSIPMWVWLHGRGDTATDIHFIASQMKSKGGQFKPKGTIVVHPFGRYCNGFKSAGETDVMECNADAFKRFNVDVNRIALAGFSMGGAGAWHLGAHYADEWAVVHTGAGFVDVKRYQKLTPEKMPPWYEQTLWGVYDVPDYAANFHNVPLISYSGEIDSQRDGAEYMTEVLAKEGITRPHLIGPGMGHKYHPEVIKEVQRLIEEAVAKGRDPWPKKVSLQTRTLTYSRMKWLQLDSMEQPWEDTRIEAEITAGGTIKADTKNVLAFVIYGPLPAQNIETKFVLDGKEIISHRNFGKASGWAFLKQGGEWTINRHPMQHEFKKTRSMPGPIDDTFKSRFIVVLPEIKPAPTMIDQWAQNESQHFITRWKSLMRGELRVMKASEITDEIIGQNSLILWGDADSNSLIAKVLPRLPLKWSKEKITIGSQSFDSQNHIPLLCYPNPLNSSSYIVLNSGLTFREAHDKTNSLQNPKLPDWAILDITQPPNAESAGKVVAADFFDEHWQVKKTK